MPRLILLWTSCLLIAPLLLIEAVWARRNIPRLPEGRPPNHGGFGDHVDRSVRVVGIGDSVIAGVGCSELSESVTACVAEVLHERENLSVDWSAYGCNGDRVRDVIEKIPATPAQNTGLVIVSVGVNDVTGLTSLTRWHLEVAALIASLRERFGAPILLLGVPPMGKFIGLPQPLRFALGVRGAMLDRALARAAALLDGVVWLPTAEMFDETLLAADGYHPSAAACRIWAERIVSQTASCLKRTAGIRSGQRG